MADHCGALLDHLVGTQLDRLRDPEVECAGGLHVDHELETHRSLNRQLRGLLAVENPAEVARGATRQVTEDRTGISRADLQSLRMPVLLMGGERGTDRCRRILDAMQECLPAGERVTIPGASHDMSATHPRQFNGALRAFLDRDAA